MGGLELSALTLWLIIICIALATFTFRALFLLLSGLISMPPLVQQALRYVPAAALAALVLPSLVYTNERLNLSLSNERLLAGALAFVVAWYTRNILLTIVSGMLALWALQMVL